MLSVRTSEREQFVDITEPIQRVVDQSGVKEGICLVFIPHTTAGITINEGYDDSVKVDILEKLAQLVPMRDKYRHSEGNSDAHIKASLVGNSVSLPVSNGKLSLGTWQKIFLCEFDGPRSRMVYIQIVQG